MPMSIKRVKALGASLVCSVLNTRWPVSDAWMAALGRFQVAHFADEDHVGIVAQDAAQGGGEGQADLGVHLNLADARLLILDRVFDGDDLGRLVLDLVEGASRAWCSCPNRSGPVTRMMPCGRSMSCLKVL